MEYYNPRVFADDQPVASSLEDSDQQDYAHAGRAWSNIMGALHELDSEHSNGCNYNRNSARHNHNPSPYTIEDPEVPRQRFTEGIQCKYCGDCDGAHHSNPCDVPNETPINDVEAGI